MEATGGGVRETRCSQGGGGGSVFFVCFLSTLISASAECQRCGM